MQQRTALLVTGGLIVLAIAIIMIGKYRDCIATSPDTGCPKIRPYVSKSGGLPYDVMKEIDQRH